MTIDALVWVPRMFYYLGVSNKGLPEQWFTGTVVMRDIAVLVLCALVLRQIYRPVGGSRAVRVHRRSGGGVSTRHRSLPRWLPAWLRPRPPVESAPAHSV